MTVVRRTFRSVPVRSSGDTWRAIALLLAPDTATDAYRELLSVTGVTSSLLVREVMQGAPIVVYGSGPRVRVYCLYGEAAIGGETSNEAALSFDPTQGDWKCSLPCPAADLAWITDTLATVSTRITVRDMSQPLPADESQAAEATEADLNLEAFFRT